MHTQLAARTQKGFGALKVELVSDEFMASKRKVLYASESLLVTINKKCLFLAFEEMYKFVGEIENVEKVKTYWKECTNVK